MTVSAEVASGSLHEAGRTAAGFRGKYLSITSFRPNGTAVATPVWFVEDGGRLYVDTDGGSYKVKRIRANPSVLVAPCSASGRPKAPPVPARAHVVSEMPQQIRTAYEDKYRVDRLFVLPVYRLVQAFRRRSAPSGPPVVLVITPTEE